MQRSADHVGCHLWATVLNKLDNVVPAWNIMPSSITLTQSGVFTVLGRQLKSLQSYEPDDCLCGFIEIFITEKYLRVKTSYECMLQVQYSVVSISSVWAWGYWHITFSARCFKVKCQIYNVHLSTYTRNTSKLKKNQTPLIAEVSTD